MIWVQSNFDLSNQLIMKSQILSFCKQLTLWCLIIVIAGLSSCSMTFEKRHYRKGYHIEVVKNNNRHVSVAQNPVKQIGLFDKEVIQSDEESKLQVEKELNPIVSTRNSPKNRPQLSTEKTVKLVKENNDDNDLLISKNRNQREVLEKKIGESRLTYKPNKIGNSVSTNGAGEMVLGILAFVFGVFALVMSIIIYSTGAIILASVFASFAFLLGIIGTPISATRMNPDNMSMTLVGLVLSALAILFAMIVLVILVL